MTSYWRPWYFIPYFVAIAAANISEMYIIIAKHQFKNKFEFHLFSLALADFLVGLCGVIKYALFTQRVFISKTVSIVLVEVFAFSMDASLFIVIGISFDRFIAVTRPYEHKLKGKRYVIITMVTVWCVSLLNIAFHIVLTKFFSLDVRLISNVVVMSILTVTSVMFYLCIYCTLNQHKHRFSSARKSRVLRMSVIIITSLFVTHWPIMIITTVRINQKPKSLSTVEEPIIISTSILKYGASLINPMLYFFYKKFL